MTTLSPGKLYRLNPQGIFPRKIWRHFESKTDWASGFLTKEEATGFFLFVGITEYRGVSGHFKIRFWKFLLKDQFVYFSKVETNAESFLPATSLEDDNDELIKALAHQKKVFPNS